MEKRRYDIVPFDGVGEEDEQARGTELDDEASDDPAALVPLRVAEANKEAMTLWLDE